MRVLVILKASENSEASVMPKQEDIESMIRFNEEMMKAGVLKSADGLKPSKFGKRMVFRPHRKPSVTDGPFAETKELIAGYWLWEVKSMDEALEWAQRFPEQSAAETHIELRTFWEPEDFAEALSPEMMQKVDDMNRQEDALNP